WSAPMSDATAQSAARRSKLNETQVERGRHYVGCSGWAYTDWRGRVYPKDAPPSNWLALYARRFATVEINNTFYRLPSETQTDAWAAQAPAGFIYAVKLGQYGSHRKKL